MKPQLDSVRHAVVCGACVALALLAGCALQPAAPAAPALELVGSGRLDLPAGCEPGAGVVYRTRFVVQPDGGVSAVASESGAGCVQDALQRWVSTFRYRPVQEPTPATVDWMGVTAARGG